VFGPDRAAFDDLAGPVSAPDPFAWIEAPMLTFPGRLSLATRRSKAACTADWDVLLACVSFPKQERFAHALRAAGRPFGRDPVRGRVGGLPDREAAARAQAHVPAACRWNGCTGC
jgi:hypothetical protein